MLFVIHVLEFLEQKVKLPVEVLVDNVGAMFIAENPVTKRTKHIDTRYHVIREYIRDGTVILKYVKTAENVADIFTKNVTEKQFAEFTDKLIVKPD